MPKAPPRLDPADPVHNFARQMRSLRLHAGDPSLGELARAMSCSHSTISAYLNGRRLPPPRQLASFVLACKGNTADFLQRLESAREQLNQLPVAGRSERVPARLHEDEVTKPGPEIAYRSPDTVMPETGDSVGSPQAGALPTAQHDVISTTTETGQLAKPGRRRPKSSNGSGAQFGRADSHITVALIPVVADGLRRLQERTNLSRTDLANRAITSYEFLDAQLRAGHELIVRDARTGETRLVRFL
jgi:transcriptional regulator with XRE-family HTH domain